MLRRIKRLFIYENELSYLLENGKLTVKLSTDPKYKFMNLYFLSGLGADKRVFKQIQLPEDYHIYYIDWIKPKTAESLGAYSKRLAVSIDTTQEYILVGLSFGGLVAVEMSQFLAPTATILISSVSVQKELPIYHRQAGKLKLYQYFPYRLFKMLNIFVYWLFSAKTKENRKLIKAILKDTDYDFFKWAIKQLVSWENTVKPPNLFHIHGTFDKVFPIFTVQADYEVKKGGHFMVLNQAKEVSDGLMTYLNKTCH